MKHGARPLAYAIAFAIPISACGGPPPARQHAPTVVTPLSVSTVAAKPSSSGAVEGAATPSDEIASAIAAHGRLSSKAGSPWLVEDAAGYGTRVWRIDKDVPTLAEWVDAPARVLDGNELVILWPRSVELRYLAGDPSHTVPGATTRTIAWEADTSSVTPVDLLNDGHAIRVGSAIGSFDTGKMIAHGEWLAASEDKKRVLLCAADSKMVDFDVEHAVERASFTVDASVCGYSSPTYAERDSLAIWFSAGEKGAVIHVLDLATGKDTTRTDSTTSIDGLWITASRFPPDPTGSASRGQGICLATVGKGWTREECRWALRNGRVVTGPPPSRPPRLVALGAGGVELARATSPDGKLAAVTTAKQAAAPNEGLLTHLELTVLDAKTHRSLATTLLFDEPFTERDGAVGPVTSLRFFGNDRVVFDGARPSLPTMVYDVAKHEGHSVERSEDTYGEPLLSPYIDLGAGKVFDVLRLRTLRLLVDADMYRAAHSSSSPR